jgi:hypothetical protein
MTHGVQGVGGGGEKKREKSSHHSASAKKRKKLQEILKSIFAGQFFADFRFSRKGGESWS